MVYFPDSYLDDLIREDAPYGDETSTLLGIEDQPGMVVGAPKVTGVVSGVSVAAKLCRRVGLKATEHVKDGDRVEAGTPVLTLEGTASWFIRPRSGLWKRAPGSPVGRVRWWTRRSP